MIPQEQNEAVTRALRETFGVTGPEGISRITKGRTPSLVYRIVVNQSPYLLKIITRAEDPTRHYTNMRAAAEAGLAPRVFYTNTDDRVSITGFVESEPLSVTEALVRMPAVLRELHRLPPFETAPFNTTSTFLLGEGPARDGFLEKFRAANLLPPAELDEWFARLAELTAAYPKNGDMVASHNDLFKPDNILFDGEHIWLVDWEAAFLNDRYTDLAVVANQLVTNDHEELAFLQEYFGTRPNEYQLARFHTMQQLSHLFYTMAFLFQGSMGEPIDLQSKVPEYKLYRRRFWTGEADLVDRESKILYARVHWQRLKDNVQQPRYRESLRIITEAGVPAPSVG